MSANKRSTQGASPRQCQALAPQRRREAIQAASGKTRTRTKPETLPAPAPLGKGRQGLKPVAIYMNPAAKAILVKIAEDHDMTIQDLGLQALNLLFEHYDEKPMA